LLVFAVTLYRGYSAADARALTVSTLVLGMVGLICANRSWASRFQPPWRSVNPALWWVIAGALGFLTAVLYLPSLANIFRFAALHPDDLAICVGAAMVSGLLVEVIKRKGLRPDLSANQRPPRFHRGK
jgi:Ca2+-transporting ATPase